MKIIIPLFILTLLSFTVSSQIVNYIIPFNTQSNYLKSLNYPDGVFSDSLLVINGTTRWTSKRPPYTGGSGISISVDNVISTSSKRINLYSGITNALGVYTVTYGTPFSVVPNIQYNIGTGGNNKETILLTASTTTGFTVYVQLRADVLGLLPSYSNVNGRNVDIVVLEK